MSELKIRVKPVVKKRLEELKSHSGLSINYYVNYAIVKQLVLDRILKYWELDDNEMKDDIIVKYPGD